MYRSHYNEISLFIWLKYIYFRTTTVEIFLENVNDNEPSFISIAYEFHVAENSAYPLLVGQVTALDLDGDSLAYNIVGGGLGEWIFTYLAGFKYYCM